MGSADLMRRVLQDERVDAARILVVGGDGLIGSALCKAVVARGGAVAAATTRRQRAVAGNLRFLDLGSEQGVDALDVSGCGLAYVCAGLTKHAEVEADHATSRKVNVDHTLRLCRRLLDAGSSLVFLSTSAVFDGERPSPREEDPVSPATTYGRQKREVEEALLEAGKTSGGAVKIVRLSKVLAPVMPLLGGWKSALAREESIAPFRDLRLSPVSLPYVLDSLLEIGRQDVSGLFHLSGAQEVSYAELARELACRWGYPPERVRPVTSREVAGGPPPYAPRHPALGMPRTTALTGIVPQSLEECVADLANAEG